MSIILNFYSENKKNILFSCLFSFLFSLLNSVGFLIDESFSTQLIEEHSFLFLALLFILFLIFSLVFFPIFKYKDKISIMLNKTPVLNWVNKIFFKNSKKSFLSIFLFITLFHIPAFIAYFPGIYTYDTWFQYDFFIYKYHVEVHPIFHSVLIYLSILINKFTNSPYIGVFLYTLFQQIVTNLIFTHCVFFISKRGFSFIFKLFALLFFAIYPINQVFPLIATKDVFFALFVLELILISYNLIFELDNKKIYVKDVILFVVFAFLALLFRHNFLHSYILCFPLVLLFFSKDNKTRIKTFFVLLAPCVLFFSFNLIKPKFNILPPPVASSIGIPLQQMARVKNNHSENLDDIDKKTYASLVTEQNSDIYYPLTVDFIKETEHSMSEMQSSFFMNEAIKKNPKKYLNLWLKWGLLYPREYIDAFLCMNYHYWYIGSNASNLYKKTGRISNAFILTINAIDDYWGIPVKMMNLLPYVKMYYTDLLTYSTFEYNFTKIFYSMACNFWFLLLMVFLIIKENKSRLLLPLLFVFATFLTVLFAPISLFRYIYQNYLIVPLIFSFCFGDFKDKNIFL